MRNNMNQEIIAELKTRIENNLLEDDTDLLIYIQLASRLKALGDSSAYNEIEKISQRPEYNGRLEEILKDRCAQGIWDVNEQLGEELGFSIIEAQDFWLHYIFSKNTGLFSKKIHPWFESWADEANHAEIDEETQDVLERFLETYPIPEEQQLGVMAAPVTEFMCDVLEAIGSRIPITEIKGTWSKPTKDVYVKPKPRKKPTRYLPIWLPATTERFPSSFCSSSTTTLFPKWQLRQERYMCVRCYNRADYSL